VQQSTTGMGWDATHQGQTAFQKHVLLNEMLKHPIQHVLGCNIVSLVALTTMK
jgi:hypothetical protein